MSVLVTSLKNLLKPAALKTNNPYIGNRIETEKGLLIPPLEETYTSLLQQLDNNRFIEKEDKELFKLLGTYIKDWAPIVNYQQLYELFNRVHIRYVKSTQENHALHNGYRLEIPKKERIQSDRMLKMHEIFHGVIHIPDYICLDEGITVLVLSQYWNNGMPVYNYNYSTMITSLICALIGPNEVLLSANAWSNKVIVDKLTEIVKSKEKALKLLDLTTKYYELYKGANLAAIKAKQRSIEAKNDETTKKLLDNLMQLREEFTREFKVFADIQIESKAIPEDTFDYSKGYVTLAKPFSFYTGKDIYINGLLRTNLSKEKYLELMEYFGYDSLLVHKILESLSPKIDFDIIKGKGLIVKEGNEEKVLMLSKDELTYILINTPKQELTLPELEDFITSERKRIQRRKETNHTCYKEKNKEKIMNPEIEKLMANLQVSEESATNFITRLDCTTRIYKRDNKLEIKSSEFDEDGIFYVATETCSVETLKKFIQFNDSISDLRTIDFKMMASSLASIESDTFDEKEERKSYLGANTLRKERK